MTCQSETSKSDLSQEGISSEPVEINLTNLLTPDGAEFVQSETMTSESSVILILEPLVLESPMESQHEISKFHNVGATGQSEINRSLNIADIRQSELTEFVNIVPVQSEFNQTPGI